MKKLSILITISILFKFAQINAQYIPDNGFAAGIAYACPTCIDAGHNLTADAQTLTSLHIEGGWGITDLTGLDGFINLQTLICRGQYITNFPALPTSLISLTCDYNELTSLPTFPSTLQHLNCDDNFLTSLPTLPSSLRFLVCSTNGLTSLPNLPSSCDTLFCFENPLTSLPALPSSMKQLYAASDQLTSLPTLPASLETFDCSHNNLSLLPVLPGLLDYLDCHANSITSLPTLPNFLTYIDVSQNSLSALPSLPSSLAFLECYDNDITSLPTLPNSLIQLDVNHSQLTSLPSLPNSLIYLDVGYNQLTSLPSLPVHLNELYASNCGLVNIAPLPDDLYRLYLADNSLTSLPNLPSGLGELYLNNNPIVCLPFLPASIWSMGISGTNINCFPNYPNYYINWLPLCDAGNINGCIAYPMIKGNVYGDFNNNGVYDTGDFPAEHAVVKATPGDYIGIADRAGNYKISVPLATSDTARATEYSVYYNSSSTFYTATFDSTSGQVSFYNNFGLLAVNSGANLDVSMLAPHFVPGFNSNLCITLKNVGTTIINGTVVITFDPSLTFISADQGGISSSNTITWNFNPLNPFQSKNLVATVNCPSSVSIGTVLFNDATGTLSGATDIEIENNSINDSTMVVGSFDPNDKQVNDATLTPDELANGKYLEYTIRFQNTGTAPATFITVVDTLSDKLNATTFQMISASHHYDVTLANDLTKENHPVFIKWLFNNIQLPDSSVDFSGSQGFVKFRIGTRPGLLIGDEIENTAGIYFDFNEPVITNTASTFVAVSEGTMNTDDHHFTATLFPNPASTRTTIHLDNITSSQLSLEVLNEVGVLMMQKTISVTGSSIDVNLDLKKLASGIYTVTAKSSDELRVVKLVKE